MSEIEINSLLQDRVQGQADYPALVTPRESPVGTRHKVVYNFYWGPEARIL